MKTFRLLVTALLVAASVGFSSCGDDNDAPIEPQNPKEYIVSIGYAGEFDITEAPLSKVKTNDLYGIQIYSKPNTDTKSQDYKYYALGLFNDGAEMNIKLLDGYQYKIVATIVKDGDNKLYKPISDPFSAHNGIPINKFQYTSSNYFYSLDRGLSRVSSGSVISHPNLDRYYGELIDYIPQENGHVNINMKRTSFEIKILTNNFTQGTIIMKMNKASQIWLQYPQSEFEDMFTLDYCSNAYYDTEYQETEEASILWRKDDGVEVSLGTKSIPCKRNTQTIITVNISENPNNYGMGLTIIDEPMKTGDYITFE